MPVDNPGVVDIIGIPPDKSLVALTISDHLDWSDSHQHLTVLQEKLNRYLAFIESGELLRKYPDATGKPVSYAVVEVTYLSEQLTTRSGTEGAFSLKEAAPVCGQAPPASVTLLVQADEFRPKRQTLGFDVSTIEVRLEPREFRP